MEIKNDEFDKLMGGIQEDMPLKKKYEGVNKDLGVGFADYFQMSALYCLNSNASDPISFPLSSVDAFKDLKDQDKVLNVGKNKKSFEFMKSSGQRYLISICLVDESRLGKLHDYEFVKRVFWAVDSRHDVKEVSFDHSGLDRCLIHYIPSGQGWRENVYVVISVI